MKVLFETKKLQKSGRIALSDQLLRNAGLQVGDPVDIYFDASTKNVIVQRATSHSGDDSGRLKLTEISRGGR
jgi:bifunctional DNA-binding transcriptional regulator/antitoxin component of YhaV-PrlF toxin-antitoxin module